MFFVQVAFAGNSYVNIHESDIHCEVSEYTNGQISFWSSETGSYVGINDLRSFNLAFDENRIARSAQVYFEPSNYNTLTFEYLVGSVNLKSKINFKSNTAASQLKSLLERDPYKYLMILLPSCNSIVWANSDNYKLSSTNGFVRNNW
jgi:hypothetical protein